MISMFKFVHFLVRDSEIFHEILFWYLQEKHLKLPWHEYKFQWK